MAFRFQLIEERSRVLTDPDGTSWLAVVYALDPPLPPGTRQTLVPALRQKLEERGQKLLAVDLFDEFVRIHMPLDASAPEVEEALQGALNQIEPAPPPEVPKEAQEALERYLRESRYPSSA